MGEWENTSQIAIPSDPFERIIGQDEAVRFAKLVARQRRHLLLAGPPGTGKSLIAQAISSTLPKPQQEISVVHNPEQPERPLIEIRNGTSTVEEQKLPNVGKIIEISEAPAFVSERLGFRCSRCGAKSRYEDLTCTTCGADKIGVRAGVRSDGSMIADEHRIVTTRRSADGRLEQIIYERSSDGKILVLNPNDFRKINEMNVKKQRRVIVPLTRSLFVQASGGSETELLGDVRHDPYGGQAPLGVAPYLRVLPGAIHEAHEGVLFVDELATLGVIQKHLLTAMQEKVFQIVGRNPTSSGAAVRVDNVPCDFILVGSVNITDLPMIMPSLRSRIRGNGYEVLMAGFMEDNPANRFKIAQFVAQEISKDGKIPHAARDAVDELIEQGKRIAKRIDNTNGITLRLRNLTGIIKLAGDIASAEGSAFITKADISAAIKNSASIEQQVEDIYGNMWKAGQSDYGIRTPVPGPESV